MKRVVSPQQEQYIIKTYLEFSDQELADKLGLCSKGTVRSVRKRNNAFPPKDVTIARRVKSMLGKTSATKYEDDFIKANYLTMPVKAIAAKLNRCGSTFITTRLRQLGLTIPPEIIKRRKEDSQIKKGTSPPNKGKRHSDYMSEDAIKRTEATRFAKGQKVHNEREDGAIRHQKDKNGKTYQYIRISKSKWELLHRKLWRDANGEIPEGMIIVFKDNNPSNCNIDNLEMICRTENMLRNSRMNYPEEIIPTLTLINKLKRKTNEKQANRPK